MGRVGANWKVFSYIIMQFFSILQIDRFYVMIMTLWHLFLNRKKLGSPKSFFHVTKEVQQIFFNISIWPQGGVKRKEFKITPWKWGNLILKMWNFIYLTNLWALHKVQNKKLSGFGLPCHNDGHLSFWKGCFRLTPFWERVHLIFCYFLNLWAKKNYLHKSQIPGWYNHRKSANC